MHYTTAEILTVCGSHGSMHDFKRCKKSMRKLKFKPFFIVDKGYLGRQKLGFGCLLPSKAKKTEKLDSELKKLNRAIGRRRIQVEHVCGRMKCFKIVYCVYSNRRKSLNLRFNLLAGIYNLDWVKDKQLN